MSDSSALNTVFIQIHRSLLQYAGECWPWASANAADVEKVVRAMAADEQQLAARIFAAIDEMGAAVDYGVYPDHSSLHYVSLGFMLRRAEAEHTHTARVIKSQLSQVSAESPAAELLRAAGDLVDRHLAKLSELARAADKAAAA